MSPWLHGPRAAALLTVAVLVGCEPAPQVSRYTAEKDPYAKAVDEPVPGEPRDRILGAIAPAGGKDQWYFLKITSTPKAIEPRLAEFDAIVASLKFAGDTATWTLPPGWKEVVVKSTVPRMATLRSETDGKIVDLAVSQIGGDLLENINRWRDQVGQPAITADEIKTKCRTMTVDGREVIIVDVSGTLKGGPMMPPMKGK